MTEWIAQAAPLRKALQLKKANDRSLLLSINEITHYFYKWTTGGGVLKKITLLYTVTRKKCKVKSTPKEQLFGESSCFVSHTCKCNCLQVLF